MYSLIAHNFEHGSGRIVGLLLDRLPERSARFGEASVAPERPRWRCLLQRCVVVAAAKELDLAEVIGDVYRSDPEWQAPDKTIASLAILVEK